MQKQLSKMPKWIWDQALPTKDECPLTGSSFQAECKLTPVLGLGLSFPIDSIRTEQKNWTPSIPFWFRLRLTYISGHDSWMQLDPQTRTWP
jgi:hypothetical protein